MLQWPQEHVLQAPPVRQCIGCPMQNSPCPTLPWPSIFEKNVPLCETWYCSIWQQTPVYQNSVYVLTHPLVDSARQADKFCVETGVLTSHECNVNSLLVLA